MKNIKYIIITIFLFSFFSVKGQKLDNTQTNDSLPKQLKPLQLIDGQISGRDIVEIKKGLHKNADLLMKYSIRFQH